MRMQTAFRANEPSTSFVWKTHLQKRLSKYPEYLSGAHFLVPKATFACGGNEFYSCGKPLWKPNPAVSKKCAGNQTSIGLLPRISFSMHMKFAINPFLKSNSMHMEYAIIPIFLEVHFQCPCNFPLHQLFS